MPQTTRELRRRIKGIGNTKKITRAMELVAASKMRRAVQAALATRTYALHAWTILTNLAAVTSEELHPLLAQRPLRRGLLIVFSSDRGLAGGLNTNVAKQAEQAAAGFDRTALDVVAYGRKAEEMMTRLGYTVVASFTNPYRQPMLADVLPVARIAVDDFRAQKYDRVVLVWTDYESAILQRSRLRTILPITREELAGTLREAGGTLEQMSTPTTVANTEYLFEPSPAAVLSVMLERLVETQLYQTLLEATASEHAARMVAMRNATDAADELIDGLTLTFNQARQAAITSDLSEISASRAALA